ncbi:phosphoadenosine phosphosulfate reductase domain-containing protein [Flexilinea flocculi]|uniref:phosphoadenosine phosphosulfate reductase domain-containing protein n=1 Tax=Flexilinea flocculi TaxID=1678840 RepID=UPI001F02C20B|nr:phosphoadenosine phosphosulfate reductase family protein [Flexilinea flocculi]
MLNTSPTGFSKEPRPVYAQELDILGFDQYWNYDKQMEQPYMWAEANTYWYRGVCVAKLKGGNLYTAPEIIIPTDENGIPIVPEPDGNFLRPVDIQAMVSANLDILQIIEQTTVKKILAVYEKYKGRLDLFHVAFSGGKDSAVLLDLVKKALPKGSFVVVFGDTGMEFPDTYDVVNKTQKLCEQEEIPFYIAKSHFDPEQSWKLFGPPSRVLRWCCSVHKSTPQTLLLREITGINNYIGLDFVGVRAHESATRSDYKYENFGKKQRGQYSHNSILEWTSAEIWSYIYANNIVINEAYKKGNGRAGCLFCPMSGGISDYFRRYNYKTEIDRYINLINQTYDGEKQKKNAESYIINGGWNARKNGREITNNANRCIEKIYNGNLIIEVTNPRNDWTEWIKTIGVLLKRENNYSIFFNDSVFDFDLKINKTGYIVTIPEIILKDNPAFGKLFRQVFRKASYCSACRVCETNCRKRAITFLEGKIKINNCSRCHDCHNIDSGCLLFHSLRHPQGGGSSMKSLNSFADHAPKPEWLRSFFELKEAFYSEHTLGPMMYDIFRRFLKDASLNEKNHFTKFASLISKIGWETNTAWGLILVNLVNENPQIEWYIESLDIGHIYKRQAVEDMLIAANVKPKDAKSIVKAFKRLTEIPLGMNLHFGYVTEEGDLVRTKCSVSDPRVLLYGLFKFAEKCNDYKEFTLATLLNDSIDRDGISPTRIFGLDREDMTPLLLGLSAKYPEFISASFTHDLEKITLAKDKTSSDVLELF